MSLQSPEFRHVTEDVLREWKSSTSAGFKVQGSVPMDRFLYELCWALVRGDLPLHRCRVALDSVEFSDVKLTEGMDSVFADIIAHLAQDPTILGDCRTRLVKLAKWLVDSSVVPHRLLQERCEEDFLWESDVIQIKAQDLRTKEVRVNTRLLYQQTKFNLLREESEGYAKLVTLLSQIGSEAIAESTSVATISVIKSLIGHFDLDPNRVFDVVLECFELHPDSSIFYSLIPIFQKSNASQILGFKFQYYQRMEVKNHVPLGLYRLAALMVKADLIDLDSVGVEVVQETKDKSLYSHCYCNLECKSECPGKSIIWRSYFQLLSYIMSNFCGRMQVQNIYKFGLFWKRKVEHCQTHDGRVDVHGICKCCNVDQ